MASRKENRRTRKVLKEKESMESMTGKKLSTIKYGQHLKNCYSIAQRTATNTNPSIQDKMSEKEYLNLMSRHTGKVRRRPRDLYRSELGTPKFLSKTRDLRPQNT